MQILPVTTFSNKVYVTLPHPTEPGRKRKHEVTAGFIIPEYSDLVTLFNKLTQIQADLVGQSLSLKRLQSTLSNDLDSEGQEEKYSHVTDIPKFVSEICTWIEPIEDEHGEKMDRADAVPYAATNILVANALIDSWAGTVNGQKAKNSERSPAS